LTKHGQMEANCFRIVFIHKGVLSKHLPNGYISLL